jgi:RNA methyltransferase, TrmH family
LDSGLGRRRQTDPERILDSLDSGRPVALLLVREGALSPVSAALVTRAEEADVKISFESEREMRRMSEDDTAPEVLAVEGVPPARDRASLMRSEGLVFLLVGLRYPSNVGFILRSAEVAGAAGVVVANDWSEVEWAEASRVSIRAERFFAVLSQTSAEAHAVVGSAREAGRQIVAVETTGRLDLWRADLARPSLVVLGSETLGIPGPILSRADEVVRIPTHGFIPSYNVQAATGILLGEWLRQTR